MFHHHQFEHQKRHFEKLHILSHVTGWLVCQHLVSS